MRILKSHPLLKLVNSYVVDSPQPSNISYLWNFGSLLAFSLVIQIITGVTLAMHYNPSVLEAFNSVEHIMRDVNNGWLIRYLHSNTASAFFFVVYLHIGRGLYYGSYQAPRTLVWTMGTIIFILMMAIAFLGYVLPYGQMSLWGATVITNLMSAIPWVGQDIVEFLWGGFSVNNATLNRFFSLHFVLPFVLAALALMHLISLHDRAGSGNPLGVSGNYDRLPFAPYYIFKDLITIFIFIIVLSVLVFFMPNLLGDSENYVMANPMQTPPAIVPEWYLLPFYAILRSIPNKLLGVIAMFTAILILLVMPFTDISRTRGAQFRPISKIAFFIFIGNFLILMQLGAKHVESPFIELGQISTMIYFAYFLFVVPTLTLFENSLTMLTNKSNNKLVLSPITIFQSSLFGNFKNKFNFSMNNFIVLFIYGVFLYTVRCIIKITLGVDVVVGFNIFDNTYNVLTYIYIIVNSLFLWILRQTILSKKDSFAYVSIKNRLTIKIFYMILFNSAIIAVIKYLVISSYALNITHSITKYLSSFLIVPGITEYLSSFIIVPDIINNLLCFILHSDVITSILNIFIFMFLTQYIYDIVDPDIFIPKYIPGVNPDQGIYNFADRAPNDGEYEYFHGVPWRREGVPFRSPGIHSIPGVGWYSVNQNGYIDNLQVEDDHGIRGIQNGYLAQRYFEDFDLKEEAMNSNREGLDLFAKLFQFLKDKRFHYVSNEMFRNADVKESDAERFGLFRPGKKYYGPYIVRDYFYDFHRDFYPHKDIGTRENPNLGRTIISDTLINNIRNAK